MECYCYCNLRSVQDFLADGKTLYERRFGELFEGPIIPFGAMVEHPIFTKDQSRLNQFGKETFQLQIWSWERWTRRKSTLVDSMHKKY